MVGCAFDATVALGSPGADEAPAGVELVDAFAKVPRAELRPVVGRRGSPRAWRPTRAVVATTRKLRATPDAKAKPDRLGARTLARLPVSGLLDEAWTPDERSRT